MKFARVSASSSFINLPSRPTPIGIVRHEPVSIFNKTWRVYMKKSWKLKQHNVTLQLYELKPREHSKVRK